MRRLLKYLFITVVASGIHGNIILAQSVKATVEDVRSRFESTAHIQWLQTFKGYWQTFHPVEIILGFDGTHYYGSLHLISGDVYFDLQGYRQDGKAMLQEIDATGRTSGYLVVQIVDGLMTGQWWSTDFERSAEVSLRNDEVIQVRRFEPQVLLLEGYIKKDPVHLIVQREESNLLSGFCTSGTDKTLFKLAGRCQDGLCDMMQLNMRSSDGEERVLDCQRLRGAAFKISRTEPSGPAETGTANVTATYAMERLHYAGYSGNIDCVYPVLSMPLFDTWLEQQIDAWGAITRRYLDSLQTVHEVPGPDIRWSVQASAWVDFTFISNDIVSGIITRYSTTRNDYVRDAFIFDPGNGKLLSVKDLGRRPQFVDMIKEDAAEIATQDSDDPEYLKWLDSQDFNHIALSKDGFVLFTDFDAVFGDKWVMLKFRDYIESLKRNALVFELKS